MYKALARTLLNTGITLAILTIIISIIAGYTYWHIKPSLPNSDFLKNYHPPELTRIYDRHFNLAQELSPTNRIYLSIEHIPEKVIAAFLVAEDKNFFYHPGLDPARIFKALFQNFRKNQQSQSLVGASTITQQVAKNFLVGNEKSFLRKIREAFATLILEQQLSKERILELYLNQIYLGNGAYGIQAAALKYFKKSVEELTIAEASLLASLPKAPAQLSASKNAAKLETRRSVIIQSLLEQGYISFEEAATATTEPLHFSETETPSEHYEYYTSVLQNELEKEFPTLHATDGLEIFSYIDVHFQKAAEKALRDGLLKYDITHKNFHTPITHLDEPYSSEELKNISVPDCPAHYQKAIVKLEQHSLSAQLENQQLLPLDTTGWAFETSLIAGDVVLVEVSNGKAHIRQIPEISGAIVVMEARTGQVLAAVGGWSYATNPFNCATQAWRQPGSSFKPFVYLAALEQGTDPNDIIKDESITMLLNNGREVYRPKNVDKKFHGFVTVKNSLAYSHNLAAIQLGLNTGLDHIQDIAELFEIYNSASQHPSIILGSKETTLLRLTTAYAMIFNGGYHLRPKFYKAFTQRKASSLQKNINTCCFETQQEFTSIPISTITNSQRLASPSAIFGLLEMLRAAITHGTGKSLLPLERQFGVTIRGKTGTTNDNRDAWFIGSISVPGTVYQDDNPLVIGVFVGFPKPKSLGEGNGGAAIALPIFGNFIKNLISDIL